MKWHDLKTWPGPFQDMWLGLKDFEVRLDDRDYQVGDGVNLLEYHPHIGETGRRLSLLTIKYKLAGGQFGIEKGYCVLGLDRVNAEAIEK